MFKLRILEFVLSMFIVSSIIGIMNDRENIKKIRKETQEKYKHYYNDNVILNFLGLVGLYILKIYIGFIYYMNVIYKD